MSKSIRRCATRARSNRGWALVAIMTISVFATMFLFSLAGLSVSLIQTEGASRQRSYALAAAEAGLDYARVDLSKPFSGGESALAPADEEPYRDYGVESKYLPQLGNSCKVMIRVSRIDEDTLRQLDDLNSPSMPDWLNSYLRKDTSDWKYGDDWQLFGMPEEIPCWKVEVTAYCGIFASSIRSIFVGAYGDDVDSSLPQKSYFSNLALANGELQLGSGAGPMTVQSPGSLTKSLDQISPGESYNSMKASVKSNGSITAADQTSIFADLYVTNPVGAADAVASANDGSKIWGRVEINSIANDGTESGLDGYHYSPNQDYADLALDNVLAASDQLPTSDPTDSDISDDVARRDVNRSSPVTVRTSSPTSSESPNPVPNPANLAYLPPFPVAPETENSYVFQNPPVDPSSYATYSLDSTGATGPLQFNIDPLSNVPTKIFIQDPLNAFDANSPPAVELNSKMISNGRDASSLQLYYSGSRPINLKLDGELKVVIYAPNSNISTSGSGDLIGAVVGKNVSIQHKGTFQLDPNASKITANQTKDNESTGGGSIPYPKFTHFKIMTWQQLSGSIVPLDG